MVMEAVINSTVNSWLWPMNEMPLIAIDFLSILWPLRIQISLILTSAAFLLYYTPPISKDNGDTDTVRTSKRTSNKSTEVLPQPPTLPIIGNLHQFVKPGINQLTQMLNYSRKLGPIFKLKFMSNEFIVLSCPVRIQKLLSSTNPNHLNKHRFLYDVVFSGYISDGLTSAEYERWNPHRKILSRSFTFKSLKNQLTIMNFHTKEFLKNLPGEMDRCSQIGADPEISEMIQVMMLNSLLHFIIGMEICTDEEQKGFRHTFQRGKEIITQRVLQPWLMFDPLWRILPLKKELRSLEETGEVIVKNILARYRARTIEQDQDPASKNKKKQNELDITEDDDDTGIRPPKSMMEDMLNSGMSDKEIFDEMLTMTVAGQETTSGSLTFLLMRLALNPDIQHQCRLEVDEVFDAKLGNFSETSPTDEPGDLSMEDLTGLKYLERCVYENLRLLPIVPLFLRRLDAPLKLDDKTELHVGSNVAICPYTLHRDPEIFPDPEKFDPDRFLPDKILERHQFSYLPFSAGIRNCIGWKQSIRTIKVVTAWILRNYEIHTSSTWEDIGVEYQILLVAKNKVNLILKKRNKV